jgi:hypothetical protein
MKKFFVFLILLCTITSLLPSSGTKGNSYGGIFDRRIYDQSDQSLSLSTTNRGLSAGNLSDIEIEEDENVAITSIVGIENEAPEIKLLRKKKLQQLNEKHIVILGLLLKAYEKKLALEEGTWFERIVDDFRRNSTTALVDIGCWISHWLEGGTIQPSKETNGKRHAERGRVFDNLLIDVDLLKLKAEIDQRKEGLEFEAVFDLEKEYVVVKRDISPPLQEQVERSLLLYRDSIGNFLEIERRFINCALNLPRSPKALIRVSNRREDLAVILSNIRSEFTTFSSEIIRNIVNIAVEIVNNSICDRNSYGGKLKTIQYFWGKPGGGKTTTVLKLADILGLPCVQVSVSSAYDLSPQRLEGTDRFGDYRSVGWFLSPLLKPGEDKKTYSNAILLIDDIDLEISPDEVLSILKFYLDPLTKVFDSPYFNCSINVERMNIFVTSNGPIPKTEKYASLRSRVPEVEFPSYKITEDSPVLRKYVEEEAFKTEVHLTEENTKSIINAAHAALKKKEQEPDLRNMRRIIEDLVREISIDSFDTQFSVEETITRFLARE